MPAQGQNRTFQDAASRPLILASRQFRKFEPCENSRKGPVRSHDATKRDDLVLQIAVADAFFLI